MDSARTRKDPGRAPSVCWSLQEVVVMKRRWRWLVGGVGAVVLLFGLGCLNYTNAEGWEHHQEVARRRGLPAPSHTIFLAGVAATALGAGTLGFALGRR